MNVTTTITTLLLCICPPAIGFLIIARIINAIYRVFVAWALPHIVKEGSKGIFPIIGHTYTTSAITRIRLLGSVIASSLYATPYFVFDTFCKTMCFINGRTIFFQKTAAGLYGITSKVFSGYYGNSPTNTFTIPKRYFFGFSFCLRKHNKPSKSFSSKFYKIMSFHAHIIHGIVKIWNPFSGKGIYRYSIAGAWAFLG